MKLLVQTIAGRFGYFITKKATLDKLTNELAETKALLAETSPDLGRFGYVIVKKATLDQLPNELAETNADLASLREQNRALGGKKTAQNSAALVVIAPSDANKLGH